MRKFSLLLVIPALLCLNGCALFTYVPKVGMKERKWLRNTLSNDLVYMEGNVKAYRAAGSYYYFREGTLVRVSQSLVPADQI